LKNGGRKREGRAQKEKRGPGVSANSSSLSRARARVSSETCWSLRLAPTTFSSSGDSWSEVREGGTPSEAPEPNAVANAIGYAQHYSRSHDAVIRVYDAAGNVIETHEHKGDFSEAS